MNIKVLSTFIFYRETANYVMSSSKKYDLFFYLFFIAQTFLLASLPSGFHSPTFEGWLGFYISVAFVFIFYPLFYIKFYADKSSEFIREVIIFSVVSRLTSFILVGLLALIQISLWALMKLPKLASSSLIYYLLYYVVFSMMMVRCKKLQKA